MLRSKRALCVLFVLTSACARVLGLDDYQGEDASVDVGVDTGRVDSGLQDAAEDAPVDVGVVDASLDAGTAAAVRRVALGAQHTCALTDTSVFCWGANALSQLGMVGPAVPVPTRVALERPDLGVDAQLVVGDHQTCVVNSVGELLCWGDGTEGELGPAVSAPTPTPTSVEGVSSVEQIVIGENSMCANAQLMDDACMSAVVCWGSNENGRLGRGTMGAEILVPRCVAPQAVLTSLSGHDAHYCGIEDDVVWCWGSNDLRQVADTPNVNLVRPVESTATSIRQIAVGRGFTCALNTSGEVRCWGGGAQGQLGDGNNEMRGAYPTNPVPFADGVVIDEIALGDAHACARSTTGRVFCWGQHLDGRLGIGDTTSNQLVPAELSVSNARSLVVGSTHSCVITTDDELWCWGENPDGRVGNGTLIDARTPQHVVVPDL